MAHKILVVDDEEIIRDSLFYILEKKVTLLIRQKTEKLLMKR